MRVVFCENERCGLNCLLRKMENEYCFVMRHLLGEKLKVTNFENSLTWMRWYAKILNVERERNKF